MAAKKKKKVTKKSGVSKGAAKAAAPAVATPTPVKRTPVTGRGISKEVQGEINKINSKYGRTLILPADDISNMHHIRRPSGIMQLDIDCGGGLQAGTFNTITGPDNAGKSTLLYKYCAMQQKLYGNDACIAFHAAEDGGVDYWRARRMGWIVAVPMDIIRAEQIRRQRLEMPLIPEDEIKWLRTSVGQNIQIGAGTQEEVLDAIEDLLAQNVYNLIWIDSLEAMLPNAEATLDSLEDNPMQAAHARNLTRFFQRYAPITNNQENPGITTLLGTCQVRSNRKKAEVSSHMAKYMSDWAGTNVRAIRHWRQVDITLKPGEKLKNKTTGIQYGKQLKWEITKGKGGTHDGITGEVEFFYDEPTHTKDLDDLVLSGLKYGAIRESDGMLTLMLNAGTEGARPHALLTEVPNKATFVHELTKDFDLELEVREHILQAAGKNCLYR
jgi:RecA/RadA recombinase